MGDRPHNLSWLRETIGANNVNQRDVYNRTIFSFVCCEGSCEDVQYLLSLGIELQQDEYEDLPPVLRRLVDKRAAFALLQLRRRCSRVIGGNNHDVLRLIAKCVKAH